MAPSRAVPVTGCSSGIGRATAERPAATGRPVYASARQVEAGEGLGGCRALRLDVTDDDSMREAVTRIEREERAVGVLVDNAGFGQGGRSRPCRSRWPGNSWRRTSSGSHADHSSCPGCASSEPSARSRSATSRAGSSGR